MQLELKAISEGMKVAAADAISECVTVLDRNNIIPSPFDPQVPAKVARRVAEAAMAEGLARVSVDLDQLERAILERNR